MADTASKIQGNAPANTPAPRQSEDALPDLTGRTLGDYQILRRLGVGGMGQVYLARQLSLKREVALKLLRDELNKNPTALLRFQAEAEAVAKLNHPNIVHIHQMGEADGLRYMALEYVEGRNLRDHLARKGPPDLLVSISIIRQVVLALQQAHEHGIVHRDIKPENILVTRKVEVKVTDFGLSRFFAGETPALNLTQSGMTLGTPLYMSPEQVQGQAVDHRSDIYSFGVTCYHLLAGEPPFRGATAFDVALKHVQDQPQPLSDLCPDLPAELCAIVHRMMAKNPNDRQSSAREILKELARVREGLVLSGAAPASGVYQQVPRGATTGLIPSPVATQDSRQQFRARANPGFLHKWGRWAIALAGCLLAATIGIALSSSRSTPANTTLQPPPQTWNSADSSPGLQDVRPAKKIIPTRERELLALINTRGKAEDIFQGWIELGLLYIHERRLDEAAEHFKKLETERFPESPTVNRYVSMTARLGKAIVLAYRDQKNTAQASNDAVMNVVNDPFPKADKKSDKPFQQVATFLLRRPDLYRALSEALNRNLATLAVTTPGLARLEPPQLELLRAPPRLALKP